ncbi:MAG: transposase [Candidatus Thiodiazotropha lotti]|nr:transposase [Candidatus Thiodiazotropha lotti]MCW4222576.1 transposase [Candidatus Thiodiazotropha lotti]
MQQCRKYLDKFKLEAVSLANQSNVSLKQVAEELWIIFGMLGRWRSKMDQHGDKAFIP